jgi:alditol oxidase
VTSEFRRTSPSGNLRNWAGNVVFSTGVLRRPRSIPELQEMVAGARQVRALGAGHSFNRIADTPGALISLADLPADITIDEAAATAEVPAGASYAEISPVLAAKGWALPNLASLPHISIAGACCTGTHGSGARLGCLSAQAVAVEFVRADGELVRVGRDDPAFPGSVLTLGALGIMTRLRLAVVPSFAIRQTVWVDLPLAAAAEHFDAIMTSAYSVSMFRDWTRPGLIDAVWLKSLADAPAADLSAWGARPATAKRHPIPGQDPAPATGQSGIAGPWYLRLPHFSPEFAPSVGNEQQSEYFIPREHGPEALAALARLDLARSLYVGEIRTVAADGLWLSPCRDRPTVAFHFTWINDDEAVAAGVAAVETALGHLDVRPHWAKVFRMPPEQVRPHYPDLPRFRDLAGRHDPDRKFGNPFLARYIDG